jgi:VWFA-related protein
MNGQGDVVFSTDVKVVSVLATVRDGNGQIARGLAKEDFQLSEDGRPQSITYFSQESDQPLTVGLLIDVSASQTGVLEEERRASFQFVEQLLRPDSDQAFVMQFDGEAELVQDITTSLSKLSQSIASLQVQQPQQSVVFGTPQDWPGSSRWPSGSPWPGGPSRPGGRSRMPPVRSSQARGGTAMYDAIFLASDELMSKQQGRKALVILSDGVDNASLVNISQAIEYAQRSDTLVYAIVYSDLSAYNHGAVFGRSRRGTISNNPTPDGRWNLQRIAQETGARVFEVSRDTPLSAIYSTIGEELRNQYSLGYSPTGENPNRGFRKLRVTTKYPNLKVQARAGYYPTS